MIKVETAMVDGLRRARITDGININVLATEGDVDQLISQLIAWRGQKRYIDTGPAKVGDIYIYTYEGAPEFNRALKVTDVAGDQPDSLVSFEDGTHASQKCLAKVLRVPG